MANYVNRMPGERNRHCTSIGTLPECSPVNSIYIDPIGYIAWFLHSYSLLQLRQLVDLEWLKFLYFADICRW